MPRQMSEELFANMLQNTLGPYWERALAVFQQCGPNLAEDVANVFLHAVEQKKINEVLNLLEKHYHEHLQFQHPEIRGMVSRLGVNPTAVLFNDTICHKLLGLTPGPV